MPAAPGGGFRRGFAAMRHRNYRLYLIGQVVSLVGTWMQSVSLPWLVLLLGGSPLQLGHRARPAVRAGHASWRRSAGCWPTGSTSARRCIVTQIGAMIEAGILFSLTLTRVIEIWLIMALAVLLGLISAVDMPVRQAFAAELVPREDLINAIALNSASFNAARVVGPAVAGVTLALRGRPSTSASTR